MRRTRTLGRDRRASVAVEFAVLTPVLVVVMLSLYDVSNAVIAWWRVSAAAGSIARIATNLAATQDGTNILTTAQVTTASTAIFAVMPNLLTAPVSGYGVAVSSIVMTPAVPGCVGPACTFVGNTAWSVAGEGVPTLRPCGTLTPVPDGTPPSVGTLPVDAFTSSPILVVDVTYDFTPLFTTLFGAGLHFMESAYLATRTGSDAAWVRLTGPNAAKSQCEGYGG